MDGGSASAEDDEGEYHGTWAFHGQLDFGFDPEDGTMFRA